MKVCQWGGLNPPNPPSGYATGAYVLRDESW